MASLYKNGRHYYVSVSYKGTRRSISTGTSDKKNALALKSKLERNLLQDIIVGKPTVYKQYNLKDLMEKFLNSERDWKESTKSIYKYSFKRYLKSGFPDTSYKAMIVRNLNTMYKWAYESGYMDKTIKFEGGNRWESRNRVINDNELATLFKEVSDHQFNTFVRFAYYTGARSGEIRSLSMEQVKDGYIVVKGKSGSRIIKLNTQAQDIISSLESLWNYTRNFVSHKFKKEVRRLGIKNARFHDLRRTFGYNLIKQGRPIYEVSKLLGHSSVTTTERHYAPLLTIEIEDFVI